MTKQIQIAIIVAIVLGIGIIGLRQFNQPDKKIATSKEQVRKSPDVKKSDSASQEPVAIEKIEDLMKDTAEIKMPIVNTNDWNFYDNRNLGLTFKYPKNWKVTESENHLVNIVTLCVSTLTEKYQIAEGGSECQIQIDVSTGDKEILLNNLLISKKETPANFKKYIQQPSGGNFLWIDDSMTNEYYIVDVYFEDKGKIIDIRFSNDFKDNLEIKNTFIGVLNTIGLFQ